MKNYYGYIFLIYHYITISLSSWYVTIKIAYFRHINSINHRYITIIMWNSPTTCHLCPGQVASAWWPKCSVRALAAGRQGWGSFFHGGFTGSPWISGDSTCFSINGCQNGCGKLRWNPRIISIICQKWYEKVVHGCFKGCQHVSPGDVIGWWLVWMMRMMILFSIWGCFGTLWYLIFAHGCTSV